MFVSFRSFAVIYAITTVADVAVMLALMAGRNAKETMHIVDGGEVKNPSLIHKLLRSYSSLSVGETHLVSLLILRTAAERKHSPYFARLPSSFVCIQCRAHRRVSRLRPHRTGNSRTSRSLRRNKVHIHDQSHFHVQARGTVS